MCTIGENTYSTRGAAEKYHELIVSMLYIRSLYIGVEKETGLFVWIVPSGPPQKSGEVPGDIYAVARFGKLFNGKAAICLKLSHGRSHMKMASCV